jgi:hypothetical protein
MTERIISFSEENVNLRLVISTRDAAVAVVDDANAPKKAATIAVKSR